jgi:hypothetical protein
MTRIFFPPNPLHIPGKRGSLGPAVSPRSEFRFDHPNPRPNHMLCIESHLALLPHQIIQRPRRVRRILENHLFNVPVEPSKPSLDPGRIFIQEDIEPETHQAWCSDSRLVQQLVKTYIHMW